MRPCSNPWAWVAIPNGSPAPQTAIRLLAFTQQSKCIDSITISTIECNICRFRPLRPEENEKVNYNIYSQRVHESQTKQYYCACVVFLRACDQGDAFWRFWILGLHWLVLRESRAEFFVFNSVPASSKNQKQNCSYWKSSASNMRCLIALRKGRRHPNHGNKQLPTPQQLDRILREQSESPQSFHVKVRCVN